MEEKQKGTTIFYSTHILSEISKVCDRVGIIKEGKLLKVQTIEDMQKNSLTFITLESCDIDKIVDSLNLKDYKRIDNTIKFKNEFSSDELIKKLSKYQIDKILIEEATLEEIFLHYYK